MAYIGIYYVDAICNPRPKRSEYSLQVFLSLAMSNEQSLHAYHHQTHARSIRNSKLFYISPIYIRPHILDRYNINPNSKKL